MNIKRAIVGKKMRREIARDWDEIYNTQLRATERLDYEL